MTKTERTTVSITKPRFEQLAAIARHRNLPNVSALIDFWINDAIAAGEIPPELPGITCQRLGGEFVVTVKGTILPAIPAHKARTLAAVLSAAGGETDPELTFAMAPGKPAVLDLGEHHLVVSRAGQAGVRLIAKPKDGGGSTLTSVSTSFALYLAQQIRDEFTPLQAA